MSPLDPATEPARRRRPRVTRRAPGAWFLAAAALASAACTHAGPEWDRAGRTIATGGGLPDRVVVRSNRIVLRFTGPEGTGVLQARWKGRGLDEGGARYRVADLTPIAEMPRWTGSDSPRVSEVAILPPDAFDGLARRVADAVTPREPGQATLLKLGGRDLVLTRGADGEVVRSPVGAGDGAPEVSRRVNSVALADEALRRLEWVAEGRPSAARALLFTLRPEGERPRYLFFDRERRLCVLLRAGGPRAVRREGARAEPRIRTAQALTLEAHVVALLKNPVSSAARLVNVLVQTGATAATMGMDGAAVSPPVAAGPPMDLTAFEHELDSLTRTRRTRGSVRFLIGGERYFPVLEQRIAEAREGIDVRINIFDTDDVAVGIAEQLKRRSGEVRVRVLFDEMSTLVAGGALPGSAMPPGFVMPATIEAFLRRGSRVQVRPELNPWLTADHSKVLVFDRRFAHLGGMNTGREYRYEWHDMMVELEGPVVGRLAADFSRAWAHAGPLGDLATLRAAITRSVRFAGEAEREGYADVRILSTKTGDPQIYLALLEALGRARREILVENPYLYDDSVANALVRARRRGVDVRVVLPSSSDQGLGNASNMVTANALLASGVRVFVYPGMTHVKAVIVDGWATLGSANFNVLSLRRNHETNIATSDPRVVGRLRRELFDTDLAVSHELDRPVRTTGNDGLAEWLMSQF